MICKAKDFKYFHPDFLCSECKYSQEHGPANSLKLSHTPYPSQPPQVGHAEWLCLLIIIQAAVPIGGLLEAKAVAPA